MRVPQQESQLMLTIPTVTLAVVAFGSLLLHSITVRFRAVFNHVAGAAKPLTTFIAAKAARAKV